MVASVTPAFAQTPPTPGKAPAGQDSPGLAAKQIPNHTGGVVTYYSGNRLKDEESQTATNVFFDKDSGVVKRSGQSLFHNIPGCTSQVRAGAEYDSTSGQAYFLQACGGNVYVSVGGGAFSVLGGTISATANVYFAQGMGYEWIADGVDPLWSTDGVNVSSYPVANPVTTTGTAPLGSLISVFQNRLVLADVTGAQSAVYLAGYNSGSAGVPLDFTLPAVLVDTSAAIFGLNGLNDGLNVTCMSSAYRNVLILWDHNFMYGLYGSGYSTFVLRELAEIGCDEQQSVQEYEGNLRWLSSLGLYEYNGLNATRISDDVKDQILNIITTEPGQLSITQEKQSDWQGGNLTASGVGAPMSATISPGSVVGSTWSIVYGNSVPWSSGTFTGGLIINGNSITVSTFSGSDNTQANFQAATSQTNMDFTTVPNTAQISQTNTITNGSFSGGVSTGWTQSGFVKFPQNGSGGASICSTSNCDIFSPGIYGAQVVISKGASTLATVFPAYNGATTVTVAAGTISSGANVGDTLTINFSIQSGNLASLSQSFVWLGNSVTMTFYCNNAQCNVAFLNAVQSTGYNQTASYTSRAFNVSVSSPSWGYFNDSESVPAGTTLSYQLESSVDGATWGSPVSVSTGVQILGLASNPYVRYLASLGQTSGNTPVISSVTINAASTGTFISPVFDTGLSTPTWGPLAVVFTEGSSSDTVFSVYVSTALTGPFDAVVLSTANVPIVNAQKRYVKFSVAFQVSYTTNVPVIYDLGLGANTTGYFITSCFNTTPNVGWSLFQGVSTTGNGAVSYSVSTGSTCGAVDAATATWTAQSNNEPIAVSTASYLGVRVLLSGTTYFNAASQPTLSAITINWQTSAGRPRTASQVFDNRYWLAYTTATSGAAYNNSVLVYDSEGHWSGPFKGINAASLTTYQRILYAGSSLSDGNVDVENSGTDDLGTPILYDFRTPDYELDAFNTVDLYDLNLEFAAVPLGYNPSLSVQYYVDQGTTPYSLGSVPLTVGTRGLIYANARFPLNGAPVKAHAVSFELIDNTATPLTFYRSMIRYTPEDGP